MRVTGLHAGSLASLPETTRKDPAAVLSPAEARALLYDWSFWARPAQQPPAGSWRVWLLLAGRGFGKTRSDAAADQADTGADCRSHGGGDAGLDLRKPDKSGAGLSSADHPQV